jgi:hypothetical protein
MYLHTTVVVQTVSYQTITHVLIIEFVEAQITPQHIHQKTIQQLILKKNRLLVQKNIHEQYIVSKMICVFVPIDEITIQKQKPVLLMKLEIKDVM